MVKVMAFDSRPFGSAHPTPISNIGDRKIICQILMMFQMIVQYFQQAAHFKLKARNHRRHFFREIAVKNIGLPHHRANAAHLKHQPCHHFGAPFNITRQQPSGFFRQMHHNRSGLENRQIVKIRIDDYRNAPIRIHRQKFGGFLLVFLQINDMDIVIHIQFFQRHRGLIAIGGG